MSFSGYRVGKVRKRERIKKKKLYTIYVQHTVDYFGARYLCNYVHLAHVLWFLGLKDECMPGNVDIYPGIYRAVVCFSKCRNVEKLCLFT